MVLGKLVLVENTGSARGSSHYNQVTYINSSGEVEHILLTDRELDSGRERAAKSSMVSVPEGLTLGASGLVSRQMKRGDRGSVPASRTFAEMFECEASGREPG